MSSLAQSRRQGRLPDGGTRRVTFTEQTIYDSYSEDEENEEERLLSELHGEAAEDSGGGASVAGNKRKETDQDIAAELVQEESRIKKKPRPTLQAKDLLNADGLIKIPIDFATFAYRPKKGSKRDIAAAAAFSRGLVNKVRQFCDDLFPSMAYEDVLLKIEQFGGKKETKSFLQHMREDVRNRHLERLYGKDKAEKMIQELEHGLAAQQNTNFENGEDGDYGRDDLADYRDTEVSNTMDNIDASIPTTEAATDPPSPNVESAATRSQVIPGDGLPPTSIKEQNIDKANSTVDDADDEEENEATFDDDDCINVNDATASIAPRKDEADKARDHKLDEDDDDEEEAEATFDDMNLDAPQALGPDAQEQQKEAHEERVDNEKNEIEDISAEDTTTESGARKEAPNEPVKNDNAGNDEATAETAEELCVPKGGPVVDADAVTAGENAAEDDHLDLEIEEISSSTKDIKKLDDALGANPTDDMEVTNVLENPQQEKEKDTNEGAQEVSASVTENDASATIPKNAPTKEIVAAALSSEQAGETSTPTGQ